MFAIISFAVAIASFFYVSFKASVFYILFKQQNISKIEMFLLHILSKWNDIAKLLIGTCYFSNGVSSKIVNSPGLCLFKIEWFL